MLRDPYPLFLANRPLKPNADLIVTNKHTGEPAFRAPLADRALIDRAIREAVRAVDPMRRMRAFERQATLDHVVRRLTERQAEFAEVLCAEAGKPSRDARGEVTRAIDTFRIASEESVRLGGEVTPLDIGPRTADYEGSWRRFPVGVCGFITPFNFPLNLVAHKVAPAIAVGCPFVLKPASLTPISALMLGEILAETSLPEGSFSILPCPRDQADLFATDPRIKLLSFTGSPDVGWALKARAGKKKVVLELGGNAACVVDEGADIEDAADRLILGAFYQSGQSCISVQRILIHRSLYESLKRALVERVAKLKSGDPRDESVSLGPLITVADAERIERWVNDAVAAGARILCGGRRNGAFYDATLLENVDPSQPISCREAFGPVAILRPFDSFDEALRVVNDSDFGLQAGVFTNRLDHVRKAYHELDVGGVVINDVPSFRADHMPYGGVKDSGLGREGVRFAMEEMTEIKSLVIRNRTAKSIA